MYWELEKPLSEQSKHVQQSFDALLNDLASPEDAEMLRSASMLNDTNDRSFAANLFPAYLYAQRVIKGNKGDTAKDITEDRRKLTVFAADNPRKYIVSKSLLKELQKAAAELLWSYGIAGNKHRGAKGANYVNFYDKQQQILTTAEVSVNAVSSRLS